MCEIVFLNEMLCTVYHGANVERIFGPFHFNLNTASIDSSTKLVNV